MTYEYIVTLVLLEKHDGMNVEPTLCLGKLTRQGLDLLVEYFKKFEYGSCRNGGNRICVSLEIRPEWEFYEPYSHGLWIRKVRPRDAFEQLLIQTGIDSITNADGSIKSDTPGIDVLLDCYQIAELIRQKIQNNPNAIMPSRKPVSLKSIIADIKRIYRSLSRKLAQVDSPKFAMQQMFCFGDCEAMPEPVETVVINYVESAESSDNAVGTSETDAVNPVMADADTSAEAEHAAGYGRVDTPHEKPECHFGMTIEQMKSTEGRKQWSYLCRMENPEATDRDISLAYRSLTGRSITGRTIGRDVQDYCNAHKNLPKPTRSRGRQPKKKEVSQ